MQNKIAQGLVLSIVIFVIPWVWVSTKGFVNFKFYYPLLFLISASLLKVVFKTKFHFLSVNLFVLSIVLIPFSMELMHFISFEIHWANNDVHYNDPSTGIVEMYKDYDSFYVFSYTDGNWRYRLLQAVYNILFWLIPFGFFSIFRIYSEKGKMKRKKEFGVYDSEN